MLNVWPCYWGTGGKVTYIAPTGARRGPAWALTCALEYVGTIFGGSLYGAIDPIYMLMLLKSLGPRYMSGIGPRVFVSGAPEWARSRLVA